MRRPKRRRRGVDAFRRFVEFLVIHDDLDWQDDKVWIEVVEPAAHIIFEERVDEAFLRQITYLVHQ